MAPYATVENAEERQPSTRPAGAAALQTSRKRARAIADKLLAQPTGARVNLQLWPPWIAMLAFSPAAFAVWVFLVDFGVEVDTRLGSPHVVLIAPIAAVLGMFLLGRLVLVSRRALLLLTLGFGALAPDRAGGASRCRRCHGALPTAQSAGAATCDYCGADNLMGIDLRPVVDKARAESQTFDEVLSAPCAGGVGDACHDLGLLMSRGERVPEDKAAAAARGVEENLDRAHVFTNRACNKGDGQACARLGR